MVQSLTENAPTLPPLEEKNNTLKKLFTIISILLVICALIIAVFFIFSSKNQNQSINSVKAGTMPTIDQAYQYYVLLHKSLPSKVKAPYLPITSTFTKENGNTATLTWILPIKNNKNIGGEEKITLYANTTFDTVIRLHIPQKTAVLSTQSSGVIAATYFPTPNNIVWTCSQTPQKNICTALSMNGSTKVGFTVYTVPQIPDDTFVLSCSISQKSPLYTQKDFCTSL